MVSIRTIAEECGVSIATVSKALNNHNDVGEATKKLVIDTAKRLGYTPNAQARALKTNKTYNIGVLLNDKANSGLTHAFFSAVIDGFRVGCANQGYDITLINLLSSQVGTSRMNSYEHCKYRNVDGVLLACVDFYSKDTRELLDSEIPVVSIDFRRDKCYSVSSDNAGGMKSLIEYIHNCGHERIAYIYGESSQVTTTRLNSYLDSMKALGLQVQPDYLKQGKYTDPELTEQFMNEMLELYTPPTCIILPDDIAAIGAMNAVRKAGRAIPEDVSIAGYDGIGMVQLLEPKLTTYCQDTYEMGRIAANKLVRVIQKKNSSDNDDYDTIIKGHLIEGNTVKYI